MYLVFGYMGGSLLLTMLCHPYLKGWVMILYGEMPLHLLKKLPLPHDEASSQQMD